MLEKQKTNKFKGTNGVTLIALIITIIILIILAAIFWRLALNGGIIDRASDSFEIWKDAENKEQSWLEDAYNKIGEFEKENIEYWDGTIADSFSGGDGTLENPYKISNGKELARLAHIVNSIEEDREGEACAILTNNIYLNKYNEWIFPWISIGREMPFEGVLNGNGNFISGLYLEVGIDNGLINNNKGTIENLGIVESYSETVGGMFSSWNMGVIKNCYNTGTINVNHSYGTGGIVGNNIGLIENCYNAGEIIAKGYYMRSGARHGAIAGSNLHTGIIRNSYNIGNIIAGADGRIGGIVAENGGLIEGCYNSGKMVLNVNGTVVAGITTQNLGTIKDCYNSGDVDVLSNESNYITIAGLVMENYMGTIENSYNIGKVNTDEGTVCGIAVYTDKNESISNTYYLEGIAPYGVENTEDIVGSFEKKTEQEIKNLSSVLGSAWKIDNNLNNGFPVLKWQTK